MTNLKVLLGQLKSDKLKERQQGIASIREYFARDTVVERLDESGDGRVWLILFQALFSAVVNERTVAVKKGLHNATAATLRRLEEAASAVRWLTERCIRRLNRKVVKPLLAHLLQTIVHHGQLFMPVALDYVKALHVLLSYAPHLQHLDADQWIKVVSLSFAVVLGDDLRSSVEDEEEGDSGEGMDSEHSEDEGSSPKKRKRKNSNSVESTSKVAKLVHARTVSLEEIEFTSLINLMLRSSNAPFLAPEHPNLVRSILSRLNRFFVTHPSDTSAHLDAVLAVNALLDKLALNARDQVTEFGVKIWDHLLASWSTKQRQMKEGIIAALIALFPYVTHKDASFNSVDGLSKLFRLLNSEHDSRWGIELLSLDAVRLEIVTKREREPFEAGTFKHGFNFSSAQALAWVALELQADCAKELFLLSESTHSATPAPSRGDGKRVKLENPVTSLLHSIHGSHSSHTRVSYLQSLLFLVDRHWSIFHAELQQEVANTLLQWVTVDDPIVQSWIFLCFAAIAHADGTLPNNDIQWDGIWSHTMRRTNVSIVCRAACHAAHVILLSQKLPLHSILTEIEAMAQDIGLQGPSAPYDAVCAFLAECLSVASQDVRLYRMQLEEKVLGWLTENWNTLDRSIKGVQGQSRFRMEQRTIQDMLSLLQSTCGLSKRSKLVCDITLPDCAIVDTVKNQQKSAVIRNFLLYARLPQIPKSIPGLSVSSSSSKGSSRDIEGDLVQPAGRERKASAFLLKILELAASEWDPQIDVASRPPAEKLRRSLDLAIMSLSFESSLAVNGIQPNRRVLVTACKLISTLSLYLRDISWSSEELVLVLAGFSPLTSADREKANDDGWLALTFPGKETGISRTLSDQGGALEESETAEDRASRLHLQRVIWQCSDVQDTFTQVLAILRTVLETFATGSLTNGRAPVDAMTVDDDRDDFAPIRTMRVASSNIEVNQAPETDNHARQITSIIIDVLAMAPVLQSPGGEPTRDKSLTDLICECDEEKFEMLGRPFFSQVRQMHLYLSASTFGKLLDRFEMLLMTYAFSRSDGLQLLAIHLLVATTHIWMPKQSASSEIRRHARQLCRWLIDMLKSGKIRSWNIRDSLVRFFDLFLTLDPVQHFWAEKIEGDDDYEMKEDNLPDHLLPVAAKDEDMRVRFTVALSCARLFSTAYIHQKDSMIVYHFIREQLCILLDNYEHMLTRLLCLGNIMIASSSVRRGPYWHLLETCLHTPLYTRHIESVLSNVAQMIGLHHYSELFEAYASQIAYSIRRSQQDVFRFPPHLLGYHDRKQYADATFKAFSPTNLFASGRDPEDLAHAQASFARHCQMINKTPVEGLVQCFADIVGYQIVFWMEDRYDASSDGHISNEQSETLMSLLHSKFAALGTIDQFQKLLEQNVDGIVFVMLRTIGDLDYHRDGTVVEAFESVDGSERVARAFRALMKYRSKDDFKMHSPNLPSFSTITVLRALNWLSGRVPAVNTASTLYHVQQQFFGEIARCPLVNEQLRLLQCLCIWISVHYTHFRNATLLRVLTSGAVVILAQPDLLSFAQGMLEWAFIHYREVKCGNPHFAYTCIRICSIAQTLLQSPKDALFNAAGPRIMDWIEEQMLTLSQVDPLRSQISGALAAWPRELTGDLADLSASLTCSDLSSILADHHISSQKFKLVRRLSELAKDSGYTKDQYAQYDFWRIKDCIPTGLLPDEEIDAFANLLLLNAGHIRSYGTDRSHLRSIGTQHQRLSSGHDDKKKRLRSSPKQPILTALLDMLADHTSSIVHVAYRTLRGLASIEPLDSPEYGSWPSEYRGDVAFLNFCPIIESKRPEDHLNRLLEQDFLDISTGFSRWISTVTVLLSDVLAIRDAFFGHLTSVLKENESFAEQMLPVLVHSLLQSDSVKLSSGTENGKTAMKPRAILSQYFSALLTYDKADVRCLRSVVNTVLHLRHFVPEKSGDALAYNRWLDIDFLLLSRSAISCAAYTTALLFLELASEYRKSDTFESTVFEKILFDIYSHIDEPDGFYGIKTQDLRDFLMRRFHHERQWDKAFHFHSAGFEAGDVNSGGAEGILESLHSFGFDKLAMTTLQSVKFSGMLSAFRSSNIGYQLGWRTETWDLPEVQGSENSGATLYVALRAIHRERDPAVVDNAVRKAMTSEMQRLRTLGNENLAEIRQVTQNLMCLAQIKLWRKGPIQSNIASRSVNGNDVHWSEFCSLHPDFDFPDLENIVATRISLVRSVRQREQRDQIGEMVSAFTKSLLEIEKKCLVQLSAAARGANQQQIALNSIVRAQKLEEKPTFDVSQEFANVLWLQREQKLATEFLKSFIDKDSRVSAPSQHAHENVRMALTMARLGEWASEACLEKPDDIRSHFFSPAIDLLTKEEDGGTNSLSVDQGLSRATVFHKYALFAEQQYHAIMKSPDLVRLKVYTERKLQEIKEREESMKRTQSGSSKWNELSQHQRRARALYEQDTAQFSGVTKARDSYLIQAVQMLSMCLEASDDYDDDATIRLCSLWLANFTHDTLNTTIPAALVRVPSRKFVFLSHQLSARLSSVNGTAKVSQNQESLQTLLVRLCSEHPFHSLYQVYSLQATHGKNSSRRQSARADAQSSSQADRAAAAADIFGRLRDTECAPRVRDVELLCAAYLEWAQFPIKGDPRITDRRRKEPLSIPAHLNIRKIANMRVPVTTAHTPLDATLRYDDCVWITGYDSLYQTAGGINLPKISYCKGSDGVAYKQLFKGEGDDDMRQDAVMEQVFELCNFVLRRDRGTRTRKLSIRAYKVVPLAPQAGLLEFVGNTIPMNSWLSSAHPRYHPKDLALHECTAQLTQARKETNGDKEVLLRVFMEIRARFRPVLRHFFAENHKTPLRWFEMRLRYSRSVATTSIVGHVLGLGDRHMSNILLDTVSGEVVHIDLGIAFEQGKLLQVPERVPFRLTADMVDGFGVAGTEGVFRRCAEETLRVLRDGSDVINTVLEVFKYDPLHSWTASAVKIRRAQGTGGPEAAHQNQTHEADRLGIGIDMESGTEDEAADRALTGVARKLGRALSVEHTVNELIAEATDVANLSQLFPGWSPYC